ncbi:Phosphoinositide 3-kinase adapter protein 1-like [Homarus americanus]|uniref:Phosphoinositide 3-kinase adapter protein 1-like n=1 Tax=Homarus americanus TaxID=6706 RepID=A0A8J5MTE5_HOMAM|nr:Phosphoinositide 3-kinase adapter protein 1-like [Homarus americanus]
MYLIAWCKWRRMRPPRSTFCPEVPGLPRSLPERPSSRNDISRNPNSQIGQKLNLGYGNRDGLPPLPGRLCISSPTKPSPPPLPPRHLKSRVLPKGSTLTHQGSTSSLVGTSSSRKKRNPGSVQTAQKVNISLQGHQKSHLSSPRASLTGESAEVDIAILYASDGDKWKNYLYDIIILSPCFLAHIAEHGRSELGQVFKPEKVLALLLGIDDSQFTMAHRSALYSYNDWHRLAVRNRDMSFIYEVFYEGISILNNCELYCGYRDESSARFKVTPRKVNTIQQQVYIMLSDPVNRDDVEVLIEGPNEVSTIKKWRLRNPYTIEFRMPEKFLRGSSLLFVTVLVDKVVIGSRQLKCESNMDALRDILGSVTNPTDFMCQALNISPTSDELDHKLAVSVKLHLPCNKLEESKVQNRDGSKFPTWIHFSAYYGLERLTWALLEIPGGEAALNSPNCNGHTPSVLAYQRGFSSLAHALEDAAMVSSLAAKVGYMPTNEGKLNMPGDTLVNEGTYNSPPPPRPLKASQTSGYDPLPAPREVSCTSPSGTEIPEMMVTPPPPPPPLSPALNDICDARWEAVHSPELPPPPLPESSSQHLSPLPPQEWTKDRNSVKQEERYLDMNVSGNCNDGKVCEYSADVYTLVTAWMEKTNIKTFVEKHQEKIVELKNKLDSDKMKEHTNEPAVSDAEAGAAALPQRGTTDQNERSSPDSARQKTMVGQFFGLLLRGRRKQPLHLDLEGSRSLCDLPPNDYSDDPTHSSPMKETSSETDNETSSVPVIPPRKLSDPTESSLPASHDSVSISPGPARSHKLVKLENKKHAMEATPKSRLLTEERLPQPPPRSEQSYDPYLPIEDINVKSHQEEMSRSTSNLVKTNNSLQKKKSFSGSKTPSPQTKKMDDDEELDYVTVN